MRWTPWWLIWMSWFNHEVQVLEINWTNISQSIKEINWTYILTQRPANRIHIAPTWGQRPLLSRIGLSYVIPPMWNCGMITHPFYKTTNDVGAWTCNLTSLSTYQCRANAVYPHHSLPWLKSLHVMKWKRFPPYWPFVWGIHQSHVVYPHRTSYAGFDDLFDVCLK